MPKEKYMFNPPPKRDMLHYSIANHPTLSDRSRADIALRRAGGYSARRLVNLQKSGKYTKDKAKQILSSGGELRLHIKRVKDIQPYKNSVFTQADKEYALNLMERAWRTGKIKKYRR